MWKLTLGYGSEQLEKLKDLMEYEFSSRVVVVVLGSEIAGFTHSSKKLVEVGGFPIM
jgi:intracellular sulfur oxidation DsrE/DsrF family protein